MQNMEKKEWNMLPFDERCKLSQMNVVHEIARTVYFDVEGDLLNRRKIEKDC